MKIKKIILILLILITGSVLISCTTSESYTPKQLIENEYQNEEFKISFSTEGGTTPLSDMYYSANNIPTLPTPERVGYRFAGWYFDKNYTKPYDETPEYNSLLLYMCDVTLYAKWEKEELTTNGIYEIEYECNIVEDSIVKGKLADKYGYLKFNEDIVSSETYLEKNDSGSFLRIQYDMQYACPTIDDDGNPGTLTYTVSDTKNHISDTLSIIDRTSTIQTIYYDIENVDIESSIKLHIDFYNWGADLLDTESRDQTIVAYDVEFKITRYIGLTQSFVDSSSTLEDGAYLVKTHYVSLSNGAAMLDSFNSVYSYLIASNGTYKLIKPMSIYNSDIIGNLTEDDYIQRRTSFFSVLAYYPIDRKLALTDEELDELYGTFYVPERLNGGKFGSLTYEFDADTGKYYLIMDLGTSLDKDLILYGATSGAMAEMFNMGPTPHRLTIDYSCMVKLSDYEYESLSGDSYVYNDELIYYAGSNDDLETNQYYNLMDTYTTVSNMINFFYSSYTGTDVTKAYSTRVTISPSSNISSTDTKDLQGKVGYFNLKAEAFGYDATSGVALYSSGLSWKNYPNSAYTQSYLKEISLGFSYKDGDTVSLSELYANNINSGTSISNVEIKAYELKSNYNIDFKNELDLNLNKYSFTFSKNLAIYFKEQKSDGSYLTSLIYIIKEEDPVITITDEYATWTYNEEKGLYQSNKVYYLDEIADIPEINISIYNKTYTNYDYYDETDTNYDDPLLNINKLALYYYEEGVYNYISVDYGLRLDNGFEMEYDDVYLITYFDDCYGNIIKIVLEFSGTTSETYSIIDDSNNIYTTGNVSYDKNTNVRVNINTYNNELHYIDSPSDALSIVDKKIYLTYSDTNIELSLDKYIIYTKDNTYKVFATDEDYLTKLEEVLTNLGDNYALIVFDYSNNNDSFSINYVYNMKLTGKYYDNYKVINTYDRFTNTEYSANQLLLMSNDGTVLTNGSISLYYYEGNNAVSAKSSDISSVDGYKFTYYITGNMKITVSAYLGNKDENGDSVLKDKPSNTNMLSIKISEDFTVYDLEGTMDVTYVTDANHPFRSDLAGVKTNDDGTYSYTVTLNISDRNTSLDKTYFESTDDSLEEWANPDGTKCCYGGYTYTKLATSQNSVTPTLYAVWDEGIDITANYINKNGESAQKTVHTYKSNGNYYLYLSNYSFNLPDGYVMVGWKSDDAIFYEGYGDNRVYYTSTLDMEEFTEDDIFTSYFTVDEACTITAIIKYPLKVTFSYKYENKESIYDLGISTISITEDSCVKDNITNTVYKSINKKANAIGEVIGWYVVVDNEYVEINLESSPILLSYADNNLKVTIIAIIKNEEAS